ncbi:MAG: aldolase/citrate lyase family protein [Dehalococcoidia bacterium]|nr:aldolase/citrate lyase family protein [Dehalococcoidia bacterium]MDW8119557.1 aldolase/citrate lyase family protein [Chloroflexota bacterium]
MSPLRSLVLVPAHQTAQVDSVLTWGADGVVLDLDTLVHPQRREEARRQVARRLHNPPAATALWVRLPAEASAEDWQALQGKGLEGVILGCVEEVSQVATGADRLQVLEREHGLPPHAVSLFLSLDTGKGLWHLPDLVRASARVRGVVLGLGDCAYDLTDAEEPVPFYRLPFPRYAAPLFVYSRTVYLACALGIQGFVCLGTSMAPTAPDKGLLEAGARRAAALGFTGALTLHPEGVMACHTAFPPR